MSEHPNARAAARRPTDPRARARVSVAVDRTLLEVVDSFVEAHPGLDRGRVFDEALYLWRALLLAEAREERLRAPESAVPPAETTRYRFEPIPETVHLSPSL